jgi:hypothetical protein
MLLGTEDLFNYAFSPFLTRGRLTGHLSEVQYSSPLVTVQEPGNYTEMKNVQQVVENDDNTCCYRFSK